MIKRPSSYRIKRYLIGLCFLLVTAPLGYLHRPLPRNANAATLPSFVQSLSRLLTAGRKVGISSLEFESMALPFTSQRSLITLDASFLFR